MTAIDALNVLRAQGHAVGAPNQDTGMVRIWVYGTNRFIDVKLGRDLLYLAEGKLTFEDLEPGRAKAAAG